jgi:hypothetical protein
LRTLQYHEDRSVDRWSDDIERASAVEAEEAIVDRVGRRHHGDRFVYVTTAEVSCHP